MDERIGKHSCHWNNECLYILYVFVRLCWKGSVKEIWQYVQGVVCMFHFQTIIRYWINIIVQKAHGGFMIYWNTLPSQKNDDVTHCIQIVFDLGEHLNILSIGDRKSVV